MNFQFHHSILIIGTICVATLLAAVACDNPEEHQVKHKIVQQEEAPPSPPPAPYVNPFEKAPAPPPMPTHEPVVVSHWEEVGDAFKMNESWFIYTWRDAANHNTCYFYNLMDGQDNKELIGHGMSCVKE